MKSAETTKPEAMATAFGGGSTGIELAGAIAELAQHVLQRDFRNIDTDTAGIFLIEAMPRLPSICDANLSDHTRKSLEEVEGSRFGLRGGFRGG